MKNRKVVILMARTHPGETPSSYMLKGLMDEFLKAGETTLGSEFLRDNFLFVIIPMLNPDGVSLGASRCALSGNDLNQCWDKPDRFVQPEVYYTKKLFFKLKKENEIVFFGDLHSSHAKPGFFLYGNNLPANPKATREFPILMSSREAKHFDYYKCDMQTQPTKKESAVAVMFTEFGLNASYSIQASNGSSLEHRPLDITDYEQMGKDLCQNIAIYLCRKFPKSKINPVFKEATENAWVLAFPEDNKTQFEDVMKFDMHNDSFGSNVSTAFRDERRDGKSLSEMLRAYMKNQKKPAASTTGGKKEPTLDDLFKNIKELEVELPKFEETSTTPVVVDEEYLKRKQEIATEIAERKAKLKAMIEAETKTKDPQNAIDAYLSKHKTGDESFNRPDELDLSKVSQSNHQGELKSATKHAGNKKQISSADPSPAAIPHKPMDKKLGIITGAVSQNRAGLSTKVQPPLKKSFNDTSSMQSFAEDADQIGIEKRGRVSSVNLGTQPLLDRPAKPELSNFASPVAPNIPKPARLNAPMIMITPADSRINLSRPVSATVEETTHPVGKEKPAVVDLPIAQSKEPQRVASNRARVPTNEEMPDDDGDSQNEVPQQIQSARTRPIAKSIMAHTSPSQPIRVVAIPGHSRTDQNVVSKFSIAQPKQNIPKQAQSALNNIKQGDVVHPTPNLVLKREEGYPQISVDSTSQSPVLGARGAIHHIMRGTGGNGNSGVSNNSFAKDVSGSSQGGGFKDFKIASREQKGPSHFDRRGIQNTSQDKSNSQHYPTGKEASSPIISRSEMTMYEKRIEKDFGKTFMNPYPTANIIEIKMGRLDEHKDTQPLRQTREGFNKFGAMGQSPLMMTVTGKTSKTTLEKVGISGQVMPQMRQTFGQGFTKVTSTVQKGIGIQGLRVNQSTNSLSNKDSMPKQDSNLQIRSNWRDQPFAQSTNFDRGLQRLDSKSGISKSSLQAELARPPTKSGMKPKKGLNARPKFEQDYGLSGLSIMANTGTGFANRAQQQASAQAYGLPDIATGGTIQATRSLATQGQPLSIGVQAPSPVMTKSKSSSPIMESRNRKKNNKFAIARVLHGPEYFEFNDKNFGAGSSGEGSAARGKNRAFKEN